MTNRDKAQKIAVQSLIDNDYNGSVIAGTGFGKTRVMVNAILSKLDKNRSSKALVLVPFDHLKDRFRDEFDKIIGKKTSAIVCEEMVQFECYASIGKLKASDYEIIVCDEVHLGLTDKCIILYEEAKNAKVPMAFCTATRPEDIVYHNRMVQYAPVVYEITLDECVKQGFVAPYHITCIGVELSDEEKKKYKTVNANFGYWKGQLGGFNAFDQARLVLANKRAYQKHDIEAALGFYRAIRQRKKIVDHAENKIPAAEAFTRANPGRSLVFGGDNDFTDMLSDYIAGSVVYHSKKTKKQKEAALESFKTGESNILCSTKALNQGLDIPDATIGIICGLTSKALTMIQRVGRLVRIDPKNPKKTGKVVIMYVVNSQEQKWLENALRNTPSQNVSWVLGKDYFIPTDEVMEAVQDDVQLFQDTIDGPHLDQ